ncbi:MAG: hypothetical protein P1U77_12190 [Rubripirellula sp.]|nr:hypothetical protein [Rubripirellula sp.]
MWRAIFLFVLVSHGEFSVAQETSGSSVANSRHAEYAIHKFRLRITERGKLTDDDFLTSLDSAFGKLDRNSNRLLDSAEYSISGLIPSPDKNLDGVLSMDEYRTYHGQRFKQLNVPTGLPMVPRAVVPLSADSSAAALHTESGDADLQMTPELWEQNGIIALAFNYEVTGVSKVFSQPVLNVGKQVVIPVAEVLDLSCGTVDWSPYTEQGLVGAGNDFIVDSGGQWGRTEYVLRVEDEVVAMVGVIGSNSFVNPRYVGQAISRLYLEDGRLMLNILPPVEGSGGAAFRVIVAPIDDQQKSSFRFLLGSAGAVRQPGQQ